MAWGAQAMQLSGIVTILFCGIFMARHALPAMSDEQANLARRTFKCIALVAETYVFVYLGEASCGDV